MEKYKELQNDIGYYFKNMELLEEALTHTSWDNEHEKKNYNYERLEFLGDAVLELCVSDVLFHLFPQAREGDLTEMRGRLVNESNLARLAKKLKINRIIKLGLGEEKQGGRERASILSDALEAILAAVYEDGNFIAAQKVVNHIFEWPKTGLVEHTSDAKSRLQEICQHLYGGNPIYNLVSSSGPEHAKIYEICVLLPNGKNFCAKDTSCKKAERQAAICALEAMKSIKEL